MNSTRYNTAMSTRPTLVMFILLCMLALGTTGCVERMISIDSTPPGALVWLNDREVGRTPLDVHFVYYGTYDVRLELEGYEPMMTFGDAKAPLWDAPGPDFFAEIAPVKLRSEIHWHYELQPLDEDTEALVERGRELRQVINPG